MESGFLLYKDGYSQSNLHISEQQQVDCVTRSYGCNGGFSESGYQYSVDNGLISGSAYPYTGSDHSCQKSGGQYKINSFKHYKMTCEQLKAELY